MRANKWNQSHLEQMDGIYRRMAKRTRYRPGAPSDGVGNVIVPYDKLNLEEEEVIKYAVPWFKEEEKMDWWLGCPDWQGRGALVYLVEAARLANGVDWTTAAKLARLAAEELEQIAKERS